MGKIFHFIVLFTAVSCASAKREHYEVRELPEKNFLFEDVQKSVSDAGDINELKREKSAKLNADIASTFIRIDLKRSYILDVGVFTEKASVKHRPAGKYLIITYKIPGPFHGKIFDDVSQTIKDAKVTPLDLIFYWFQEKDRMQLFLRVK